MKNEVENFIKLEKIKERKQLLFFLIIFLIFFFTPLLSVFINKIVEDSLLNAEIDKIRAEGYPTTFKELAIWYQNGNNLPKTNQNTTKIPDSENSAVTLTQAFSLMVNNVADPTLKKINTKLPDDEYEKWYQSGNNGTYINCKYIIVAGTFDVKKFLINPLPEKILELNKIYLAANKKALKKIDFALTQPFCIFPNTGNIMTNPSFFLNLSEMRQIARLFAMKFKIAVEENRVDEAIDAINSGIKFVDKWDNSPYLITYLVNIACRGIAYNNIQWLLNKKSLNEKQLQRLSEIISNEPSSDLMEIALRTELPFALSKESGKMIGEHLLKHIPFVDNALARQFQPLGTFIAKYTGLIAQENILYIKTMNEYVKLIKYDFLDAEKIADKISKKTKNSYFLQAQEMLSCNKMVLNSYTKLVVAHRNILTAIAVERYNLKYKKLPQSLDELVPEFLKKIPIDPFDAKPLKYKKCNITMELAEKMTDEEIKKIPKPKKESNIPNVKYWHTPFYGYKTLDTTRLGYMIYSISDNKKDNGGTPGQSYGHKTDITFTIIRKGLK